MMMTPCSAAPCPDPLRSVPCPDRAGAVAHGDQEMLLAAAAVGQDSHVAGMFLGDAVEYIWGLDAGDEISDLQPFCLFS
jgi:hypothetical protein